MNRLSGLWTFVKALIKVSVILSKTPVGPESEAEEDRLGLALIVAFQSWLSRNMIRSAERRRIGWSVRRFRKRLREFARRCMKSVLNRSPVTYSILCLSGKGGTAQAGYSNDSWLYRNTKSVNRLRTVVVGFAKEGKVVCN